MRIEGPYCEFGVFETVILGILASSSAWATVARECKDAASDKKVLYFGSRHIHPAVAPVMERAAIIGGVAGFSEVKIFVSGGLTPERIGILNKEQVDAFGVGSYISDASPIDMTLDIKEVEGKPIAKRGRIPGRIENSKLKRII
jgi:nicotinic acid phosphoribosyltransferase